LHLEKYVKEEDETERTSSLLLNAVKDERPSMAVKRGVKKVVASCFNRGLDWPRLKLSIKRRQDGGLERQVRYLMKEERP